MRLIRVFPRRTRATPADELAYVGEPDMFVRNEGADRVEISCTFTWDRPEAERLARLWKSIGHVVVGGPAYGDKGEEFQPGKYLVSGYVITSRGCPNKCGFCLVPGREGGLRELKIEDGWIIQDNNLLACSEKHIREVFAMLQRQQKHRVEFTGGLEAKRLQEWHVGLLSQLKPKPVIYFAYDSPKEYGLPWAMDRLLRAGFTIESHNLRCYVLIGQRNDTLEKASRRLEYVLSMGFTPFAMLYRGPDDYGPSPLKDAMKLWREFQRKWARPAIIYGRV